MWDAGVCCNSAVCYSLLESNAVSRHMARPYAKPSLASLHLSETDIEVLDNNSF